jgi:hypothetical protein
MKKIGIMTIYQNENYGSKLQSFALQETLKKLGYIGENIKYTIQRKKVLPLARICKYPIYFLRIFFRSEIRQRKEKYKSYQIECIQESDKYLEQISEGEYDKYICGSDQIWAPNQFHGMFFLDFVKDSNKKIAYAPSIGLRKIPNELHGKYRKLISDIGFLSLREEEGAQLVKSLLQRDVQVVLDPTLLLTKEEWLEHCGVFPQRVKEPYILCYFLGGLFRHKKWLREIQKKTGYKIIVLPIQTTDFFTAKDKRIDVGPKEFVQWIEHASIVCTDSYHGTIFSVNLNKEFFSFLRFQEGDPLNQNSRVCNFLDRYGLSDRIVTDQIECRAIHWDEINRKIQSDRETSIAFLKNALK